MEQRGILKYYNSIHLTISERISLPQAIGREGVNFGWIDLKRLFSYFAGFQIII